jgi:protein-S-isoprenylcysteine O-methyltransferase Ste14
MARTDPSWYGLDGHSSRPAHAEKSGVKEERGPSMLPLIYTEPAYAILFVGVIVLTRVPEVIRATRLRSQRDPTERKEDRGSLAVMTIVVGGGVILACALPLIWTGASIALLRSQVTLAGIGVIILGAVLRWWSIFTLGRYFTMAVAVRSTQAVVQAGPYRVLRHPSYTAILIMLLGVGLVLLNWASIIVLLVTGLLGLGYRVRVEEQALVEALGQPYREYMRHTKRFIPFVV